jgi:hypothetical protein
MQSKALEIKIKPDKRLDEILAAEKKRKEELLVQLAQKRSSVMALHSTELNSSISVDNVKE